MDGWMDELDWMGGPYIAPNGDSDGDDDGDGDGSAVCSWNTFGKTHLVGD